MESIGKQLISIHEAYARLRPNSVPWFQVANIISIHEAYARLRHDGEISDAAGKIYFNPRSLRKASTAVLNETLIF